jgi:hypothetical protein
MKSAVALFLAVPALACIDVGAIQGGPMCTSSSALLCTSPPDDPNLVAGLESGCAVPEVRNGRATSWGTYANGVSTVAPAPTAPFLPTALGANGSCYSACITGYLSGSSYPYAGVGVYLEPNHGTYDLSPYQSVSFAVRGTVGPSSRVRFSVSTVDEQSAGTGGTCTSGVQCNDSYSTDVPVSIYGIAQNYWVTFSVNLDSYTLHQVGWGTTVPWDPAHALGLSWTVYSTAETISSDEEYTICVDQIELISK